MKKYVLIFVMLLACFAGLNCGAESKCDAGSLSFKTEHVYLEQGKTVIVGTFYNAGDIGTRVTKAELSIDANDMAGNHLFHDSWVFSNVNAWVPARGNKSCTFTIHNSAARGYSRKFEWHVKINYSYSNDNKPTVTPTTSTKPAANSGQPQKLTDVNAIARFLLNGEFEVVEVGKHPEYGDVWAEALGAIVRFEHPNDENMPGGIALDIIGASVIKSPSGTTHFTHKADSHPYGDWLFSFFGSTDISKSEIIVYRWVDDGSLAYPQNDVCGWGRGNEIRYNYSIDGNYLTIWRDVGTEEMPIRGENAFVLKKIN